MAGRDGEARDRMLAKTRYEVAHPRPSIVAAVTALPLRPGQRVLDAGCGPGPHLGFFLDAVAPGGSVVGVDLERDRLEVAADLWSEPVAAGALRLEAGDLTRLPFADGAFDLTWSSMVLHHVADPVAALRELARVVAPGGVVAVLDADGGGSFPCLPWPPALEDRVRAAAWNGAAENYGGMVDEPYLPYLGRTLPRLLREAGLTDVDFQALAEVDRAPLDPPRETELRDWFRGWFDGRLRPYLAPADREALLALFDPEHPTYLLGDPAFFLARTWFFATGRVAGAARFT
jgi:SAM-dependent methyltransferase